MIGGNISNCIKEWQKIADNQTVLQWVEFGVPLNFNSPPDIFEHKNNTFSVRENNFLRSEIPKLLASGCIKKSDNKPRCVSRISCVPKSDGTFRVVTDLRNVNNYLVDRKCVYEGIEEVLSFIEPNDRLVTADIKNGFFHVKIAEEFWEFLGFNWNNQYYTWVVAPFGLKLSPYYFCKILRPVVKHLRLSGLNIVVYVDDWLISANVDKIEDSKCIFLETIEKLGYSINYPKSVLEPTTCVKFIGYIIDTVKEKETVWLSIPKDRIRKLKGDIRRIVKQGRVSARALARVTGQIISMSKVFLPAKLLLRNIYRLMNTKSSWQDILVLDQHSTDDLVWWLSALTGWNGKAFHKKSITNSTNNNRRLINRMGWRDGWQTTQSPRALGLTNRGFEFKHKRVIDHFIEPKKSITFIEKQNCTNSNRQCNNMCVFQGGSVQTLDIIAKNIWDLAIRNCIQIQAKHLAGRLNQEADSLSRLPASYEWYLHPEVFQFIDKIHGPHTVDRFASILTCQLKRYNSLYLDPESEGVDALHQNNWDMENNYVNCQIRLLPKVINNIQLTQSKATVIAPYWPAKIWFHQLLNMSECPPIRLPKSKDICIPMLHTVPEPAKNRRWNLYVWRVNGGII